MVVDEEELGNQDELDAMMKEDHPKFHPDGEPTKMNKDEMEK